MKKVVVFVLLVCVLGLSGCKKDDFKIRITVPAHTQEDFVFSDAEICATGDKISIYSADGLGDTAVILKPVNELITPGYTPIYLTSGMSAEFDAMPGEWFKVGVAVRNNTDEARDVYVRVEGVEVRIE